MKEKIGNLELEVEAILELDGQEYKVVNVPSADEYRGFPPSWEFVRNHMLTWRPYIKVKFIEINNQQIPALGNILLNMDEEMYEFLFDLYQTFKVNKPSIETNISTVITRQIEKLEEKIGKTFNEEEKTKLYIRFGIEASILRDIGAIN
ncbi:hypothetical protein BFU36_01200 [Sulfolobus sp. A20]|uniref:hypothetical protein n=1 Tax=Sulfolobaceae TaxID=118883 RepID=UPI0008460D33|nr:MULTISPECIES: hypothetical protein [unclassified Sulfolobus]TRM77160.1 hypothetical protein DJ532_05450 [Sulfolobus sp. A20-N-F8]TRM79221.1 hypothetical protein DJ528_02120 [Sulfolobus sp. B5]TRM80673.1 hypothetical protein DJ524_06770 [Sulfolobus sp. D5]TRM81365.1 hypothetical protein DJ531_11055 [Sulfolobus sp. A20-N-F6]TRM85415.1 hypothetical protein DJ522_00740 [Sulfolobus sp. F3]TRM85893.1 hypothetical protein DJ521_06850 [Sulfolobus sp. E3]TRM88919.1 hypothetical protein DJ529_03750